MGKTCYVYIHYKKGTNIPFYVGKGSGKRAYEYKKRNDKWLDTYNNFGYDVEIIEDGLTDDEALFFERFWEETLVGWGFILTNKIKCGTKTPVSLGDKLTDETKRKISESHRGMKHSDETKEKLSKIRTGEKHSDETKEKLKTLFSGEDNPAFKNKKSKLPMYIYNQQNKYRVNIRNKFLGLHDNLDYAIEVRDEYLKKIIEDNK
tara:strand:+ start:73 stop:687 length:615 start_codon:yes stop_codon:yes gene_type:complete